MLVPQDRHNSTVEIMQVWSHQNCLLLAVWLWARHLTSPSLTFLIYKMGVINTSFTELLRELGETVYKGLYQSGFFWLSDRNTIPGRKGTALHP